MRVNAILLACLLPLAACGSEIPNGVIPDGVGVNIHFVAGHEQDLDLIAGAGFKFIRMDFAWTGTETTKDRYDWSQYDQLLSNLEKRRLRALFILDYSNPLYEETVTSPNALTGRTQRSTAS